MAFNAVLARDEECILGLAFSDRIQLSIRKANGNAKRFRRLRLLLRPQSQQGVSERLTRYITR